jgi:hypothetical protein
MALVVHQFAQRGDQLAISNGQHAAQQPDGY